MTDDILSSAVRAARTVADDGVDDGAATRLRLRESLAQRPRARGKRWTFIAAVIASLIGSTAFALQAGWTPPWRSHTAAVEPPPPPAPPPQTVASIAPVHHRVVHDPPIEAELLASDPAAPPAPDIAPPAPDVAAASPARVESAPRPSSSSRVDPSRENTVARVDTPRVDTPRVDTPRVDTRRTNAPRTDAPRTDVPRVDASPRVGMSPGRVGDSRVETPRVEPAPIPPAAAPPEPAGPAPDAELAAYRVAHNAHFRGGDPQAALAAWDAYLARFPDGKLAPEARYDRALVLVKLSRWREARAALAPFANAKPGAYRQREAAEILAAIRDR